MILYIAMIATLNTAVSLIAAFVFLKKHRREAGTAGMQPNVPEEEQEADRRNFDKGVENIMAYSIDGSDGFGNAGDR